MVKIRLIDFVTVTQNKRTKQILLSLKARKLKKEGITFEHLLEMFIPDRSIKDQHLILLNIKERSRIINCLRTRFRTAFKYYSTTGKIKTSNEYGINYKKIIEHLKPFPKDIENYEVDHIVPLSWFDFNNPEEIKWAWAPENHQWLTKEENRSKSNNFMG